MNFYYFSYFVHHFHFFSPTDSPQNIPNQIFIITFAKKNSTVSVNKRTVNATINFLTLLLLTFRKYISPVFVVNENRQSEPGLIDRPI